MTRQRSFKQRVRARMEKTGESYTAARRMLIATGDRPDGAAPAFEPPVSEQALVAATGRGWDDWLGLLDGWQAAGRPHGEIARWLVSEQGQDGWWAQTITVGFERPRGLRAPGQRPDGWAIGATKTVNVPIGELYRAFVDDGLRERWLPGAALRLRTATAPRTARYDWEDGSTRVVAYFDELGERKSRIAIQHERLPDQDAADELKAWWRERVGVLKGMLEGDVGREGDGPGGPR